MASVRPSSFTSSSLQVKTWCFRGVVALGLSLIRRVCGNQRTELVPVWSKFGDNSFIQASLRGPVLLNISFSETLLKLKMKEMQFQLP